MSFDYTLTLLSGQEIIIKSKFGSMRRDDLGQKVHVHLLENRSDLVSKTDEVFIVRQSDTDGKCCLASDEIVSTEEGLSIVIQEGEKCIYCKNLIEDCHCWDDDKCPRCGQCYGWQNSECWGPPWPRPYRPLKLQK